MRLPVIGANWKLHKDPAGTEAFFEQFRSLVKDFGYCEIVICPSFPDIPTAVSAAEQSTIHIGAQNLYWEAEGAFTGEVSGPMIKASGCSRRNRGGRTHGQCAEFGRRDRQGRTSCVHRLNSPDRQDAPVWRGRPHVCLVGGGAWPPERVAGWQEWPPYASENQVLKFGEDDKNSGGSEPLQGTTSRGPDRRRQLFSPK